MAPLPSPLRLGLGVTVRHRPWSNQIIGAGLRGYVLFNTHTFSLTN
jgi:hypothetical protein